GELSCDDNTVTLDGNGSTGGGPLAFQWFDSNGSIGVSPTVDVNEPGDYTLVVTNVLNGCTDQAVTTVEENDDEPVADIDLSGILTCDVTTVTLDGSSSSGVGTLTYQWLDGNNDIISDEISIDVNAP